MARIGIMLPNWIGDVVMATPTLRALRRHFGGDAQLTGIMRPYVQPVLEGTSWLDAALFFDHRAKDGKLGHRSLIAQLRSARLETILLLTNTFRTALLAWLGGARNRVGYVRYGRGMLLTKKLLPPREGRRFKPVPAIDYYLALAYAVGCDDEPRRMELATVAADEAAADAVWDKYGLLGARRVVLLNGGSAKSPARRWPDEYFAALASRIARELDAAVLVNCGPAERESAAAIETSANHPRVKSLAHEADLPLGLTKACIRRSDLVVTSDSGPRHIAAAFGVPTICIFGATDPSWTLTYNPGEEHVVSGIDCAPCWKSHCPLGHRRCLREIGTDRIFASVSSKLAAISSQRVA